jgi:putative ABC transport system permease protein
VRERCWLPTFCDLHAARVVSSEGAPPWSRPFRTTAFHLALVRATLECLVIAVADARRERTYPRLPAATRSGAAPMLLQDVRFASRLLRKNPGFTVVATAALALGIGANTAIFSVIHAVLMQPLPYADPAAIVEINEAARGNLQTVSPPNFLDWKAQNRTLSGIAAYQDSTMTLGGAAVAERLDAGFVGADVFAVLGVPPLMGRGFQASDERQGSPFVVVLGHGMWQQRFGADPQIVGKSLKFEGKDHLVIGVMPRGFTFPGDIDLWFPLVLTERDTNPGQRGAHYLNVVGRLKPGVSLEQARTDLQAIEQRIAAQFAAVQGYGVWVRPLLDAMVGDVRRPLLMLLGAVGFVLLIACVNVSNLLLARAAGRRAEIAVRCALGAGRWRIVRQLLAESLLLSLAGGLLGVLLAIWGVRALSSVLPQDLPRSSAIDVNGLVLLFSVLVSLATGLLFGVVPAIYASKPDLSSCLKDARRDGRSAGGHGTFRSALVAGEVALALILLAGAGLALRSFDRLNRIDPGFDPNHVLSVSVSLPEARYPDVAAVSRFYKTYVEALASQPGVLAAGAVMRPPLSRGGFGGTFSIVGREEGEDQRMQVRPATPGYFETLRIPLVGGRYFSAADGAGGANVAVISAEAARRFWPGQDPIGKRIRIHVSIGIREREREIVGVVGDVKISTLEAAAAPVAYVPHAQYVADEMTIVVRTAGDPLDSVPLVAAQLAQIDREVALANVRPAASMVSASVAQPRFRMMMFALFALIALGLAAVGLYGVMAYLVGQRRGELGLRMALGADPGDVLRLMLREGLLPVAIGIVIGLAGAAALTRIMSTLLFDVSPFDPITFTVVPILLASVAATACYIPARRATRVDPLAALRYE